jgi:DNA-binding transcriptional ArsR family regulator
MPKYEIGASVIFHALADPSRRQMVEQLSRGPATVSQLAAPLPMSLPSVVQHLAVLEASGLVRSQKIGRVRTCQLHVVAMRTAEDWMAARRLEWEARLDRLGEYLAEHDANDNDAGDNDADDNKEK